jgi:hypothetical protein
LPGPSFGPVMYPSTDVVIPARTLVISSHLSSESNKRCGTDCRIGNNSSSLLVASHRSSRASLMFTEIR